ncbi:hypothetical protein Tco_0853679 [Tanacetum coccineum]
MTLLAKHGPVQPWISTLAQNEDPHESFNELMDTPLDFSAFVLNRLKVDTLTPELLVGPTFVLMNGSCKSLVELDNFLEEVCKATTDQLDWNNPEGQQYPHDLRKPLPLIPNSRGRQVIPFDHFINNDLAYLSGGVSSRTYATSVTKTNAADYRHIKWIEDLVPNTMWSQMEYLLQTVWRNVDRERAGAMIQAIDRQLRNRRLMRSLEKFIEHQSDTQVITMKMEILLEPTSNKLMVGRSSRIRRILKDGGEVKEFQRSFRHSDTERLSRSDEVLKLKNFKKDAALKLFKSTNQERYEHVGPEVTSSQDGEVYKMAKGDYAWLMISRSSRSHSYIQVNGTSSSLKSMITTSIHKLMNEVKDYELKTKVKA